MFLIGGHRCEPYVWNESYKYYGSGPVGDVVLPVSRRVRKQFGPTCTVHAMAQAIELQSDLRAQSIPSLSTDWLAWMAQGPISPYDLAEIIIKYGAVPDGRGPPFDMMDGSLFPIHSHHKPMDLHASLHAGRYPIVGIPIDARWPAKPLTKNKRHAVVVVGRRPGEWKILNSEGPEWGEDGCMWIDDEWMNLSCCHRVVE